MLTLRTLVVWVRYRPLNNALMQRHQILLGPLKDIARRKFFSVNTETNAHERPFTNRVFQGFIGSYLRLSNLSPRMITDYSLPSTHVIKYQGFGSARDGIAHRKLEISLAEPPQWFNNGGWGLGVGGE